MWQGYLGEGVGVEEGQGDKLLSHSTRSLLATIDMYKWAMVFMRTWFHTGNRLVG